MKKDPLNEHVVEGQKCPACGHVMDRASGLNFDDAPKPDDITLCIRCGELSVFEESLKLRTPDPMERLRIELSDDWPQIDRAQKLIRALGGSKR